MNGNQKTMTKQLAMQFPPQDTGKIFEHYAQQYPGFGLQGLGWPLQLQNITFDQFANRCDEIAKEYKGGEATLIVHHTNQDGTYFLAILN